MITSSADRVRRLLGEIYDEATADAVSTRILTRYPSSSRSHRSRLDQTHSILISYGDTIAAPGEPPLQTLGSFLIRHLPEVSHLHLLPFVTASGDGGFAVTDFDVVDPALGGWGDIAALSDTFSLMFDLVLNHVSTHSDWFRSFLEGDPSYADWFHVVAPGSDTTAVFRPRTHPLLTEFPSHRGDLAVWTTFSPEQADLDYSHPPVLEEVIAVLMRYVARGASMIRLDAVGYLWKELGTHCLHHSKTHAIVKLLRAFLDHAAPHVLLVTETNVPHDDNISYFGDGRDEAQMVYNFSLPPLVLDAFLREDTTVLSNWAQGLAVPNEGVFLNFLASHDGIGLTPLQGLAPATVIDMMVSRVEEAGGRWSGRRRADGSVSPYELNISYIDALSPTQTDDPVLPFLAAVSIQLGMAGVPAVYIHSALGSRSWWEGPSVTGSARSINRARLSAHGVESELAVSVSTRRRVLSAHRRLLAARCQNDAFDPAAGQKIHQAGKECFSVLRTGKGGPVWCVTNITDSEVVVTPPKGWAARKRCLLTGEETTGSVMLGPYRYHWFVPS